MKVLLAFLALALAAPAAAETPAEVATRYGLAGEMLVARGDAVLLDQGFGTIAPTGGALHHAGETWRLASITKQIVAAMLIAAIGAPLATDTVLDRPFASAIGADDHQLGAVTLRQLLTHHSGLADPDDTAKDAEGVPAFYRADQPDLAYCLANRAKSGGAFVYNNCDYIVAALALAGDREGAPDVWPGTHMALPGERGVPGFISGKPEPRFELGSWGAAGGLIGTAPALFAFDRALMTGKLLPPDKLAALWTPEGHGSYQALGQWVFPGRLKGCAAPKRIVQRDGEIYGVQARNFILPDDGIAVIVFTNRSADDFPIGEVWRGKGFAYDLLSAAACP